MDSYDKAKRKLDLITRESGWYVYCLEEEEWHLYNNDDELLFRAPTIEDLVKCSSPPVNFNTPKGRQSRQKEPKLMKPVDPSDAREDWI